MFQTLRFDNDRFDNKLQGNHISFPQQQSLISPIALRHLLYLFVSLLNSLRYQYSILQVFDIFHWVSHVNKPPHYVLHNHIDESSLILDPVQNSNHLSQ